MIDCLCMVPCLNGHHGVRVTPTTQYANKAPVILYIYQCIQVISMKKDMLSGITPVIA